MLLCEINRITSHLLFMATNGMDLGAVSMMIYGWREREEVLRFFEKVTGLRMNHNYIRPGGVAADLPDGWKADVERLLEIIPPRLEEYDVLMTGQPIWRERLQGVGVLNADEALALSATGPILRSTGYAWDLRRDEPYLAYPEVDFDVIVGSYGDCYDRYAIRLNEIRESMRIVEQIIDRMPAGDYRIQDKKVTPVIIKTLGPGLHLHIIKIKRRAHAVHEIHWYPDSNKIARFTADNDFAFTIPGDRRRIVGCL